MDRRWPHMHRIDGRPLPGLAPGQRRRLLRWVREVEARTGCFAFYNALRRKVHFCIRPHNCAVAPVAKQVWSPTFGLVLAPVHDVVREILSARRPARIKDRIIESRRRAGEHDSREAIHKIIEAAKPDMRDRARFLTRERITVSVP